MPAKPDSSEMIWLAWAGWRMRAPRDWRPLKVEGDRRRGAMMIGDKASALVQVKWSRQLPEGFDPKRWIAARLTRRRAEQARTEGAPSGGRFEVLAWLPRVDSPAGADRSVWYGYCAEAALLLEVLIHTEPGWAKRATVIRDVLPSLGATGPDDPTDWAVFEVSFRTPAGLDVRARQFAAGNMALLFESDGTTGRGRRLLLRQVYPVELALGKRDLAAWMRSAPFPQRRRLYPAADAEDWTVRSFGRTLEGLIRRGRKRLPWPLGRVGRRWTVSAAARDEELDRLLLAEYDSPESAGDTPVAEAIGQMNRAVLGRLDED